MTLIGHRPEHFAETRVVGMVCANCGASWAEMKADVRCPRAPRTAHGVDPYLFMTDPVYHQLVVAGRLWMHANRAGRTPPAWARGGRDDV